MANPNPPSNLVIRTEISGLWSIPDHRQGSCLLGLYEECWSNGVLELRKNLRCLNIRPRLLLTAYCLSRFR